MAATIGPFTTFRWINLAPSVFVPATSGTAENTGLVEVPLVQARMPQCKAEGKPEPTLQLYDNNANCIEAILADTYVNDVNAYRMFWNWVAAPRVFILELTSCQHAI
jgi:hypothetical protein